jgi:hypothetical protein
VFPLLRDPGTLKKSQILHLETGLGAGFYQKVPSLKRKRAHERAEEPEKSTGRPQRLFVPRLVMCGGGRCVPGPVFEGLRAGR